jgi:hypothetical protein
VGMGPPTQVSLISTACVVFLLSLLICLFPTKASFSFSNVFAGLTCDSICYVVSSLQGICAPAATVQGATVGGRQDPGTIQKMLSQTCSDRPSLPCDGIPWCVEADVKG